MTIILALALIGWCIASVPLGLLVGHAIHGRGAK